MMSEKAKARFVQLFQQAETPEIRDHYLDQYADCLLRATEWDADKWGFDPDRWFEKERFELANRGGCDYPKEVI
jgi:hypothetical protein